jgi:RNA polymerase sigma-70 factor (ECF subfamily)
MPQDQEAKILNNNEDIEIIQSIISGNINDFSKLQKKYYRSIRTIIRKMIRNENDADDLTQETFIKAYKALSSYDPKYLFSSWLMRIASNSCIDFLRKRKIETISYSQSLQQSDDDDLFFQIPSKELNPYEKIESTEQRNIIFSLIEQLPQNYRQIILLRFQQELDYNEIAEVLNIPIGTVKATLFRAKKMINILLKKKQKLLNI